MWFAQRFYTTVLLAVTCLFAFRAASAAEAPAPVPAAAENSDPRLVVLIVVDQLRADLLPRYSKYFGEDGFKRLMKRSAYFPNAYYTYGASSTAVGHATIGSGRLPRQHGIINNEWFLDPEASKEQHVVYDRDARMVGLAEGEKAESYSPRYLVGPSLGDQLKLADPRSRVFSVSLKHRAAILIGGQNPDGVFWWDRGTGEFVTSDWYSESLPAYMAEYNQAKLTDRYIGQTWDKLLPPEAYASCLPVDASWIPYDYHLGAAFPHKAVKTDAQAAGKPYDCIYGSPFGNDVVLEGAKRILTNEKLGLGSATDMLCVSFSANDVVGHIWGPNSAEMLDITVRTDRHVADLLAAIDRQVGLDRCVVALTGDHGVKEMPQVAAAAGLGGNRLDVVALAKDLNQVLADEFGALPEEKSYVRGILPPWLWFSPAVHELDEEKQIGVLLGTADYLRSVEGIADVFTAADLEGPSPLPQDTTWWLAWRCYFPGRSGEIYIHLEPHWYEADHDKSTGHGSAHSEDRHVPILLSAPGIRAGRYMNAVDPMDIAPTIAAIVGVEPPNDVDGRVLSEAFSHP